jgi:hypothetical protein
MRYAEIHAKGRKDGINLISEEIEVFEEKQNTQIEKQSNKQKNFFPGQVAL